MKRLLLFSPPVLVLLITLASFVFMPVEKKQNDGISYIDIYWMGSVVERFGQPNYIKLYYGPQQKNIYFFWINENSKSYFVIVTLWNDKVNDWDFVGVFSGATMDPLESYREFLLEILEEYQRRNSPQLLDPNKPAPFSI